MAVGAIPPPLFFERRRHLSIFACEHICFMDWHSRRTPEKHTSVDQAVEWPARSSLTN
jgi:hypothetical protein